MGNNMNKLTHHSFYVYINGEVYFETSSKCLLNAKSNVCNHYQELSYVLEDVIYFGSYRVDIKHKEYLDTNYELRIVKQTSGDTHVPKSWIEVPEGAEVLTGLKKDKYTLVFWKPLTGEVYKDGLFKSYSYHKSMSYEEYKSNWINNCVLWQRNPTTLDSVTTVTQEKLKFIEKWLNGEKIQYILGIESEKTQADKSKWHNFTEGAMRYIKRSDIKFREAPKYVTINGIEFKSVESLLKHVKKNFDLEDGENE